MGAKRVTVRGDRELLETFRDAIRPTVAKNADRLSYSALADVAIGMAIKTVRGQYDYGRINRVIAEKIAEGIASYIPLAVAAGVTDAVVQPDDEGWPTVLLRGAGKDASTHYIRPQKEFIAPPSVVAAN